MRVLKHSTMLAIIALFLCASVSPFVLAQSEKLVATYSDVAYGDANPSQKLDVYLAKSDNPLPVMVHIHGGGWRGGSKNNVPSWLADNLCQRR